MDARIRPATRDDAKFLATVMLLASRSHLERGIWDFLVGGSEEVCLAFLERLALTEAPSFCHYSGFVVAEVDGRPAAALCGYRPEESGQQTIGPACFEAGRGLGWGEGEMTGFVARSGPVLACASAEPDGSWIVENVATLARFRRQGIIHDLLGHMLDEGRRRKHRLGQISVLIGNTPAQCAYERVGFQVVDEKRDPGFEAAIGCPGVRRLQREL